MFYASASQPQKSTDDYNIGIMKIKLITHIRVCRYAFYFSLFVISPVTQLDIGSEILT